MEKGYDIEDKVLSFPLRTLGSGMKNGLNIFLKINEEDIDYICRGPVQGFKVMLHTPSDMPQSTLEYIRVPANQAVMASVSPNIITTSEDLRKYSPAKYLLPKFFDFFLNFYVITDDSVILIKNVN